MSSSPSTPAPYWGEPNSSVNWCESDYAFSRYIAEFYNSLSSLCMTVFGYYGRKTMPKGGSGLERIWWTWVALEIVGWGSVAFHGTLKWWSQALDEVPMVWTSCLILTTILVARRKAGKTGFLMTVFGPFIPQKSIMARNGIVYATICSLLITLFRGDFQFLLFHLLFGTVEVSGFVFLTLIYRERNGTPEQIRNIEKLFKRGCWSYGVGVFIWAMDLHFCEQLGWWNPEGHSWWHLLVSCGFYHLHVLATYDYLRAEGGKPEISWTGLLPVVVTPATAAKSK